MDRKQELEYSEVRIASSPAIDDKTGIINSFYRLDWFGDEPFINLMTAELCSTEKIGDDRVKAENTQTGTALNKEDAEMKAIGEAFERYSASIYHREEMEYSSYRDLDTDAVDPESALKMSERQKQAKNIDLDKSSEIWWVNADVIGKEKKKYVPSQLVYLPYVRKDEPFIRNPISTGLAAGTSYNSALFRALSEIVEREAWMVTYLNKLELPEIRIDSITNPKVKDIITEMQEKRLDVHIFELPSDAPLEIYCVATIDKTGKGPAVVVGTSAHHDSHAAILDAICETLHARPWLRQKKGETGNLDHIKENPEENIRDLQDRGLFWYDKSMLDHLDFLLDNEQKSIDSVEKTRETALSDLIEFLDQEDFSRVVKDITTPDVNDLGFTVLSAVIPEMHPLYLQERFKYLGGDRLYRLPVKLGFLEEEKEEKQLNQVPHPFL